MNDWTSRYELGLYFLYGGLGSNTTIATYPSSLNCLFCLSLTGAHTLSCRAHIGLI